MVDLLSLKPTKISRDLKGKYLLIYSVPKGGKTSLATRFPKSLLCAFEKGYNGLSGIMAQDVPKWTDFKQLVKQLKMPQIQEKFDTVIIDTATIAWDRVEEYVCSQNNVEDVADIGWGKGYKACSKEFNKVFREISMLGYGIVFLAHAEEKALPGGEDGETFVCPMLEKRAYKIINGMVDIIAYIDVDFSTGKRYLQTRRTKHIVAGSRFQYLPERFELSYENLVNNLADAIEKQGEVSGGLIMDERLGYDNDSRSFDDIMNEARQLWAKLTDGNEENARKILKIVEETFGKKMKISEATEPQKDLLELVVNEMRDM